MKRSDVCLLAAPEANCIIANCRLPIANYDTAAHLKLAIGNWQSAML
jgi:hypothetical protein